MISLMTPAGISTRIGTADRASVGRVELLVFLHETLVEMEEIVLIVVDALHHGAGGQLFHIRLIGERERRAFAFGDAASLLPGSWRRATLRRRGCNGKRKKQGWAAGRSTRRQRRWWPIPGRWSAPSTGRPSTSTFRVRRSAPSQRDAEAPVDLRSGVFVGGGQLIAVGVWQAKGEAFAGGVSGMGKHLRVPQGVGLGNAIIGNEQPLLLRVHEREPVLQISQLLQRQVRCAQIGEQAGEIEVGALIVPSRR